MGELAEMSGRFQATIRAADWDSFVRAAVVSCCDVPELVAEVKRLALRYADLVAACRAGLVWAIENGEPTGWMTGWWFVASELPPPPAIHPLSRDTSPNANPDGAPDSGPGGGVV